MFPTRQKNIKNNTSLTIFLNQDISILHPDSSLRKSDIQQRAIQQICLAIQQPLLLPREEANIPTPSSSSMAARTSAPILQSIFLTANPQMGMSK